MPSRRHIWFWSWSLPGAGLALLLLLGALESNHWLLDLCAHATAQATAALLVVLVALGICRHWRSLLALLPFALLGCIRSAPLWTGGAEAIGPDRSLRVASFNVLEENPRHDLVLAAMQREPLDVIVVSELTPEWQTALEPLQRELPHRVTRTGSVFGIGLWSRYPLVDARIVPLGFEWAPAVVAVILAPQGRCSVLGVHPPRPGLRGQHKTDQRNVALAAVPGVLATLPPPRLLIGDCNATRWSGSYKSMLRSTSLLDTADGQGWQPTWPTSLPSWLRIPIDQILVEPGIGVRRRWVGPEVGSDHLPVFAEITLPPAPR